jgi:hypothetical protein
VSVSGADAAESSFELEQPAIREALKRTIKNLGKIANLGFTWLL